MPHKLVFIVNTAAFFVSHRLPIALEAKRRGYQVELITGRAASASMDATAASTLAESGIPHTQIGFESAGVNPVTEAWSILQIVRHLRRIRPDIVHCTTPKGIMYGGIAAQLAAVPSLVLAQSGMGYAYTSTGKTSLLRGFLKSIISRMARIAYGHRNVHVVVQNNDDRLSLINAGRVRPEKVTLIPGSGVHLGDYVGADIGAKQPIILFPARMLIDKGIVECVDVARRLKISAPEWQFMLAGTADHANPSCIAPAQMEAWHAEGAVNWLGYVTDMPPLYAKASIVCLPSYREGMPKALLEAAAAGCAVVTTDTVGCREAIIPGQTGDLVAVRDVEALYTCLLALIRDEERRIAYAKAGRALAIEKFGIDAVVEATLAIYDAAVGSAFNAADRDGHPHVHSPE
jgi:glycosyltransferase involved in cell wall biosynthesis